MTTNATTANCCFSTDKTIHAQAVPATMLVQIGNANQPGGVTLIKTCRDCANSLVDVRSSQLELKRQGKLPANAHIMDVVVCNLVKAQMLENAAHNNGAGLVERPEVCSSIQWDGSPCTQPLIGSAVVFGGKVFPLCKSCCVAARAVHHMTGAKLISPIRMNEARIRAARQAEDRKAREKAKARAKAETKSEQPTPPPAPSPFALAVTAVVPTRGVGTGHLVVSSHLRERAA